MSIESMARASRAAARRVATTPGERRTAALRDIARALRQARAAILEANAADVAAGRKAGLEPSFLDRLALDDGRLEDMARAVEEIASQDDPVGRIEDHRVRPNGLEVARMRTPLGVIAVIYEARPNVTSDTAALALRSGNAILLKGGGAAARSNRAIGDAIARALRPHGLEDAVTVLTDISREGIRTLLACDDDIDLVIPRGGEGLIRFVAEHSRIPVLKHYKGVCHVYVHHGADLDRAERIVVNSKVGRPSACNAAETILVDSRIADQAVPRLVGALTSAGVRVHGCARCAALSDVEDATDADWAAEYLSLDVAMRVVEDSDAAVAHIERYGSDHTEAIVTQDIDAADAFVRAVPSSCVMVNASTRFADGGQLGLGAEVGISTSRLHAFGPMGAEGLTTLRFVVRGAGQIRD